MYVFRSVFERIIRYLLGSVRKETVANGPDVFTKCDYPVASFRCSGGGRCTPVAHGRGGIGEEGRASHCATG